MCLYVIKRFNQKDIIFALDIGIRSIIGTVGIIEVSIAVAGRFLRTIDVRTDIESNEDEEVDKEIEVVEENKDLEKQIEEMKNDNNDECIESDNINKLDKITIQNEIAVTKEEFPGITINVNGQNTVLNCMDCLFWK